MWTRLAKGSRRVQKRSDRYPSSDLTHVNPPKAVT
jgi:hypothetical protein